jgi:uracil-DNA glycosylase
MITKDAITNEWSDILADQLSLPYAQALKAFYETETLAGKTIFPHPKDIFSAFNWTEPKKVRVVIIGQDPYPTPGHAHGLAFSVNSGTCPLPKSLRNIHAELQSDLGVVNNSGYLTPWAQQGVLLLNSIMTVESGKPGSHANVGWEPLTDFIVEYLNLTNVQLVFILWGTYAQKKGRVINRDKHLVIEAPHPSPLSAYRGFFGSRPFSKVNNYLHSAGRQIIDWQL